jgi:hypothetical protein
MKKCLILFLFFSSLVSKAEYIMRDYYVVVSDVYDANIKPGTCLLTGKIIDVNDNNIVGGTISNFDRSRSTLSNADGSYSLILSTLDTSLFFYHENYGEVVIWKYNFQSQHRVEINFVSMEYSDIPVLQEKPVIYLYSDNEMNVDLTLHHSKLTFTYPDYQQGWHVKTNAQGGITNHADGKTFPYLFWEGETENFRYKTFNGLTAGTIINTDSTIAFLENSLTSLGLNAIEQTDFITYWGPRLIQSPFAFIQFLIDEEVDQTIAELSANPTPQNQRRVYMLFTPLDKPQVPFEFIAQEFTSFSRKGLTVVEWGGSQLSLRTLIQ